MIELQARAIIGNIRNSSDDCINRPRPRVQYLHFWRGIKKKLSGVLREPGELNEDLLEVLTGLQKILGEYPKPTNTDSREISEKCLRFLEEKKIN